LSRTKISKVLRTPTLQLRRPYAGHPDANTGRLHLVNPHKNNAILATVDENDLFDTYGNRFEMDA